MLTILFKITFSDALRSLFQQYYWNNAFNLNIYQNTTIIIAHTEVNFKSAEFYSYDKYIESFAYYS